VRGFSHVLVAHTLSLSVTTCLVVAGCSKQGSPAPKVHRDEPMNKAQVEINELDKIKHIIQFHEKRPDKAVYSVIFSNLPVTDNVLKQLVALNVSDIRVLALNNTKVTDAGLVHMKNLRGLQDLFLNDNQISDVGIDNIKGCRNLVYLNLRGTKVTAAGGARLRQALPKCKIDWDATGQSKAGGAK